MISALFNRETDINELVRDYEQYLSNLSDEDIDSIVKGGCFTLDDLKRYELLDKDEEVNGNARD
jgi:hypothetical protein